MKIFVDGGCSNNGNENAKAYGSFKIGNDIFRHCFTLAKTNNEAEYNALKCCLEHLLHNKIFNAEIYMDSALVVNQVNNKWKVKNANLMILKNDICKLINEANASLTWVPRDIIFNELGH